LPLQYYFLFGSGRLYPWGFIQSYGCCLSVDTRKKLGKYFDDTRENEGDSTYQPITPSASQNRELEEVNILLRDYVVDMSYFDKSLKLKGKKGGDDIKKSDRI